MQVLRDAPSLGEPLIEPQLHLSRHTLHRAR
jgi:hypothetical protein